jgi:signal transduction histidine kinase
MRPKTAAQGTRRRLLGDVAAQRVASAGLAIVLALLAGAVAVFAVATEKAVGRATKTTVLSDAYQQARFAVGAEESLERKYRLEPGRQVGIRFAQAATSLEHALEQVEEAGNENDRRLVTDLRAAHSRYVRAVERLFDAVDAGDEALVQAIDTDQADPLFEALEERISSAASIKRTTSLSVLAELERTEDVIIVGTSIAFIVGVLLLGVYSVIRTGYRRRTEAALELRNQRLSEQAEALEQTLAQRERAEEALRDSEEQLRQSQKLEAVGRLAGGVAHDFNNMLMAITGYTDALLREAEDERTRRRLLEMKKATDQAASLTGQLLAFSRKQVVRPVVLDLNTVVLDMEQMLSRLIGEHVELVFQRGREPGNVRMDPGQLRQVIMNLVVNARDAMPAGGTVTIETANADVDGDPYVLLAVTDTGIGMDSETRSHIFEPFFTTKRSGEGTGLGLATVYGIVEQSGGSISVLTEPGHGTLFELLLPRTAEPAEVAPPPPAGSTEPRGSGTILLVEDADAVRDLLRETLEETGYDVLEARNGEEALEIVDQHEGQIDLIVSDVVMPRVGGLQLAERLADSRPELRFIFMSGYTDTTRFEDDPTIAFLQKPFPQSALVEKARAVLEGEAAAVAG